MKQATDGHLKQVKLGKPLDVGVSIFLRQLLR